MKTTCQWKSNDWDYDMIVINSEDEMDNYICKKKWLYPRCDCNNVPCIERPFIIDFTKYTLLLVRGAAGDPDVATVIFFKKQSSNHLILNVHVKTGPLGVVGCWDVSFITEKLTENSEIELIVTEGP